jgi:2-oxoglutarate dehydrogenase E2 component (dihydrolipoamide succinyltransferase)
VPAAPLAPAAVAASDALPAPAPVAPAAGSAAKPAPVAPAAPAAPAHPVVAPPAAALPAATAPAAPTGPRTIEGKVGKSDTLGRLLKHNGLTAAETDEIIRALSGALDFRTIRAGQSFRIERGSDGHVTRFELEVGKGRHVRAERQPGGTLKASVDTT